MKESTRYIRCMRVYNREIQQGHSGGLQFECIERERVEGDV